MLAVHCMRDTDSFFFNLLSRPRRLVFYYVLHLLNR